MHARTPRPVTLETVLWAVWYLATPIVGLCDWVEDKSTAVFVATLGLILACIGGSGVLLLVSA